MEDIEISRGLLIKAAKMDDNLIIAKGLLGWSYIQTHDIDKAFEIINNCLKQAEALENKPSIAGSLMLLGIIYSSKNDIEKALDYYNRSLKIAQEIDDKNHISRAFHNLGIVYGGTGDYEKALDYYNRSLKIAQEIDDKRGLGPTLTSIGANYNEIGDYEKAYDCFTRSIKLNEEFGDKRTLGWSLCKMGEYHLDSDNYKKAVSYLEKALKIARKLNMEVRYLSHLVLLYLCYKNIGNEYDKKEIQQLIKEEEYIDDYKLYYNLYQLLEDTSYLETAYNQIQEKADNLEPDVAGKFLSYPIPKAIVEEWEKVK
jgi:tetratricopeptide (TPR) repeat protein